MQHASSTPLAAPAGAVPEQPHQLFEVWGDTIDARHLAWSVAIGAVVSLGAYYGARWSLARLMSDPQMVQAYAMLGGIVGCLLGGVVSALLFKPKRTVIEEVVDEQFRQSVVADLVRQYGDIGRIEDLSPEVAAELKELGLFDLFHQAQLAQEQIHHAQPSPQTAQTSRQTAQHEQPSLHLTPALGKRGG